MRQLKTIDDCHLVIDTVLDRWRDAVNRVGKLDEQVTLLQTTNTQLTERNRELLARLADRDKQLDDARRAARKRKAIPGGANVRNGS